jgi:tryptophan-rich sensory protein
MLTQTDFIFWGIGLAVALIPIHTQRMPVYWEREMQSYMPMYIPKQVFFPVWLLVLVARAGYAALFFQNTVYNDFYSWNLVLWLVVPGLLLFWNWCFFTPTCFYLVGPIATLWFGCELTMLILTIMYGDDRAWVIGFICIALAWSLVAMILSWIISVKLGPNFGVMKDAVARLTEQTIDNARALDQGETLQEYTPPKSEEPVQRLINPHGTSLTAAFRRPGF